MSQFKPIDRRTALRGLGLAIGLPLLEAMSPKGWFAGEARAKGDGPGDHARSSAAFLTGAHPFKTAGANIKLGVSVDQLAAKAIGQQTHLPSLELGCDQGRKAGECDSGYSCAYVSNIS